MDLLNLSSDSKPFEQENNFDADFLKMDNDSALSRSQERANLIDIGITNDVDSVPNNAAETFDLLGDLGSFAAPSVKIQNEPPTDRKPSMVFDPFDFTSNKQVAFLNWK